MHHNVVAEKECAFFFSLSSLPPCLPVCLAGLRGSARGADPHGAAPAEGDGVRVPRGAPAQVHLQLPAAAGGGRRGSEAGRVEPRQRQVGDIGVGWGVAGRPLHRRAHRHGGTHTYVQTRSHTRTHTCIHAHTHAHIRANTLTRTHARTRANMCKQMTHANIRTNTLMH